MILLSDIFQQNQQIAQNPTRVIRTPLQTAYDNYLKAQNNAQNTKEDEWGSAIGHSINGIAKIIASQAIKNPYERAGATRNLDNFDDRQDAMVRNWALQRMKNRNDYVQQAREQLGLAREDDDKNYNRELTAQQIAYQKAQDAIKQKNQERQQEITNKWREIEDINKQEALKQAQIQQDFDNKLKMENAQVEKELKQAQTNKINYENSPEYRQQVEEQEKEKIRQDQLKKNQERVFSLLKDNSITPALAQLLMTNPELMPYLKDSGKYSKPTKVFGLTFGKGNDNKFDFNYEQYLIDNNIPVTKKNIKELQKQLGL